MIDQTRPEAVAERERLQDIIRSRSFSNDREITLASGRKSWLYFNMKPTMMDPEGAHLLAELLVDKIDGCGADYIGGLEMGAVPIVSFLAPASFRRGKPMQAFFVRKQAKGHGTQQRIEGLTKLESLEGKKVVMLEDVTTTGGSILKAIEDVRAAGAEVLKVVTLIDRQEGAEEAMAAQGVVLDPLFKAQDFPKPAS
jgi:orotate phosphoribosyltransferase